MQLPEKRIAILGGGPSGLFLYKRLIETGHTGFTIDIFEAKPHLGEGMPYSREGAGVEHITNVSGNEIPPLATPVTDWLETLPRDYLEPFNLNLDLFNEYKVLPRLLFGEYLSAQFDLLRQKALQAGFTTNIHLSIIVTDIIDEPESGSVTVKFDGDKSLDFDHVIVCTGHHWPRTHEGKTAGYYDSPYPPSKLARALNHPVAIRGSSLTAIDAIRTLARNNGTFTDVQPGRKIFQPHAGSENFSIVMHSRSGLLPAVRFHLDDPRLSKDDLLSREEIRRHMAGNEGFLSLDFIFEMDFKQPIREKDPAFYELIKKMRMEEFVDAMMQLRESIDPFDLFKAEYAEAKASIKRKESIHWKEMLAVLSFAMNYPAKHFSAEDMLRLQKTLMPLISIVIAFVPQSSCEELIALHDAGRLRIISVGSDSRVEPAAQGGITYFYTCDSGKEIATRFETFVDCTGQPHLSIGAFPFRSLVTSGAVTPARLKFRSRKAAAALHSEGHAQVDLEPNGDAYLKVPGIAIADNFQAVSSDGTHNPRLCIMAVPYIGGFNPDYSGLDFCEEASHLIVDGIISSLEANSRNNKIPS